LIQEYKNKIEDELDKLCKDLLELLDKSLLPNSDNAEGKVFFHKMKGDYYRYLGEFLEGNDRKEVIDAA